ncbi:hypothetical protein BDV93DRAFT_548082 [Ceratobasidium sp. AG-I]|nr:hypothetical protein BDV93DRAFT_548082 [Ceratobasidium sp. AG-I]
MLDAFRMRRIFARDLYAALRVMPNLKDLTLSLTSKALTLTLNNLNPPFNLKRFSYSGETSNPVIRFLKDQPSITELGIWSYQAHTIQCELFQKPQHLPHLRKISGNLKNLLYLGPLRPIEAIVIVNNMETDSSMLARGIPDFTTPIVSIRFIESIPYYYSWTSTLQTLQSPRLISTLRYLQVEETSLVDSIINEQNFQASFQRIASLLGSFVVLETFELHLADVLEMPRVNTRVWAGSMGRLSSWVEFAASLKRVVSDGPMLKLSAELSLKMSNGRASAPQTQAAQRLDMLFRLARLPARFARPSWLKQAPFNAWIIILSK